MEVKQKQTSIGDSIAEDVLSARLILCGAPDCSGDRCDECLILDEAEAILRKHHAAELVGGNLTRGTGLVNVSLPGAAEPLQYRSFRPPGRRLRAFAALLGVRFDYFPDNQ